MNTYGYVLNNPINLIDPKGLNPLVRPVPFPPLIPITDGNGYTWTDSDSAYLLRKYLLGLCSVLPKCQIYLSAALGNDSSSKGETAEETECKNGDDCDLYLEQSLPSRDGKTYTCIYKGKGRMFTFQQAVGYSCPPIDKETCMVDTRYIMPPARY